MSKARVWLAALALGTVAGPAAGAILTYTSEAPFQSALDGSFTLINLDAAPFSGFGASYRVETATPAAAFLTAGIDFFGFNAEVRNGQDAQIAKPGRDRLILNGAGFGGEVSINFTDAVNGIGAWSNNVDFGRIQVYSEANLGGTLLGEVQFGPGRFGGLTSDVLIGSAHFTCDFNADRRCGIFDIQFGTFAEAAPGAPSPAPLALIAAGLIALAARRRR